MAKPNSSKDTYRYSCPKIYSVCIVALVAVVTMSASTSLNNGYAQMTTVQGKEDVFKVIVTLFGVEPTTGNMVTFVTVDNMSKIKTFDAAKYYIPIEETIQDNTTLAAMQGGSDGVGHRGMVELYYSFPNATSIKNGDDFRVCSLVLKDLRMICETGQNTPALRAENVDMSLDTAKFLKVEDMKGASLLEDDIDAVEEAVDPEETGSDETDEEEEEE